MRVFNDRLFFRFQNALWGNNAKRIGYKPKESNRKSVVSDGASVSPALLHSYVVKVEESKVTYSLILIQVFFFKNDTHVLYICLQDTKKRKGLFQRHLSHSDTEAAAAAAALSNSPLTSPQYSKMGVVITSSRQANRRYVRLKFVKKNRNQKN